MRPPDLDLVKSLSRNSLFLRCFLFALPIWLLLLVDVYVLDYGLGRFSSMLHLPGAMLMLLVNPTWQQLHNYRPWQHLIGDFLFYYLLVLVIVYAIRRFRKRSSVVL